MRFECYPSVQNPAWNIYQSSNEETTQGETEGAKTIMQMHTALNLDSSNISTAEGKTSKNTDG